MKKLLVILAALAFFTPIDVAAQSKIIKVSSFQIAENDLSAQKEGNVITFKDTYTKEEKICPIIKVKYPTSDELNFEGKYVEAKKVGNEYWVYVYEDTKNLKIFDTSRKALPVVATFRNLGFSSMKEGTVYTLVLDVQEIRDITSLSSSVTMGLGWNFNPSSVYFNLGFNYKHFGIELEFCEVVAESGMVYFKGEPYENHYGLQEGKTWGYTFYPNLQGAVRLGYDIRLASRLALTPQIGATIFFLDWGDELKGKNPEIPSGVKYVEGYIDEDDDVFYDENIDCIAGTIGARFMWTPFGNRFRLQVTPYYKFPVTKSELYEQLSDFDKDIKSWGQGFGITAGLMYYF